MFRDRDFDLKRGFPVNEAALTQDLELDILVEAMAGGDDVLLDVAKHAVLASLEDPDTIVYRQQILADCLEHASQVREIYDLAVEAIDGERRIYRGIFVAKHPDSILRRSVEALQLFAGMLGRLRQLADAYAGEFRSEGFTGLFASIGKELDDEYLHLIDDHLRRLRFRGGVLLSAELGKGMKGADYVLRTPLQSKKSWTQRLSVRDHDAYSFEISDRDESGAQALSELRERGINLVANALAQSTDHIRSFFVQLRHELGFYLGCLNLHAQLTKAGEPTCCPAPLATGDPSLSCQGLYDPCLAVRSNTRTVGNDVRADGKPVVMITGANQGGKSTLLRGVGLAYLMMQCGMFVAAESFRAGVGAGVFTHFKREEDAAMNSGKLDEELNRMSEIADRIGPNCVLLCNESFAATNEREGAEIARQIIRALSEAGVRVFFVTHSYDLAHGRYLHQRDTTLFLRAERHDDGRRSFKLIEREPLPTSFGEDLYERIFGGDPHTAPVAMDLDEV